MDRETLRKKLLAAATVLFLGSFSLGFFAGALTEFSLTKKYTVITETHLVQKGENLMDICLKYRKYDKRDPYIFEFMDEIRNLNPQLVEDKNQIFPGEKLLIQYKE